MNNPLEQADELNEKFFLEWGYKKFVDQWCKPVYYWEEWDDADFRQGGCIQSQRQRTGIHAWRSLDYKLVILEKDGEIIKEIYEPAEVKFTW